MADASTQLVVTTTPIWRQRLNGVASGLWRAPKVPTAVLGVLLVFALFGPWIAPHDPVAVDLANSFAPPAWHDTGTFSNLLGTDKLGRDILSRLMRGARVSLSLSLVIIGVGGGAGVILGLISGYSGRKVDAVIQRGVEVILAMPTILVALVFVFTVGRSFESVMFILSPFLAARFTRIVRGETLSVRERDFVAIAQVIGTPTWMILFKHILPNVFNTIIVLATLEVGHLILLESSLSFLGVGVPPPHPAWGLMVADGREFISSAYWITLFPGLAILAAVLSLNLFGDWLRDTLDPRRRQL
ncbi:MAG: ABC transporter permease [Dehalococcoidia bacterium]